MPNSTTMATAPTMPMAMRVRRPTALLSRSKRISSWSFSTKADPHSTSHSQAATARSDVHPTGKLKA